MKRFTLEITLQWDNNGRSSGEALAGMLDRVVKKELSSKQAPAYEGATIVGGGATVIRIETGRLVMRWERDVEEPTS